MFVWKYEFISSFLCGSSYSILFVFSRSFSVLFVLFLLAIVLSILHQYTASVYPFGIYFFHKFVRCLTPVFVSLTESIIIYDKFQRQKHKYRYSCFQWHNSFFEANSFYFIVQFNQKYCYAQLRNCVVEVLMILFSPFL